MLQATENQRMMADDEVAAFGDGFVNNFFGDIQTYQSLAGFRVKVTDLKAGIVVTLLPLQRRHFGDAVQNVFYGHKFKIEAQN